MGGRGSGGVRNSNIITAFHITSDNNVNSILQNDFDVSMSGQGAGDNWGDGIYFTTGELEKTFYSHRLNTNTGIQVRINTSNMFTADLGTGPVLSPGDMYDRVIRQLPERIQKDYEDYYKNVRKNQRIALSHTIAKYYTGLIIKQNQPNGLDPISGGNQIVVYDKSVISNRKRMKK